MSDEIFRDEGGKYVIDEVTKERKRVDKPQEAAPPGGGARDAAGKPIDAKPPEEHNRDSMPEAPKHKPWESPPAEKPAPPAAVSENGGDKKGRR